MQNFGYKYRRGNQSKLESDSKFSNSNIEFDTTSSYQHLREYYEMRLKEFSSTLTNTVSSIVNDPLMSTMQGEATSQQFVVQRIQEIIEECIHNDRESLVRHLYQQKEILETEYQRLEIEYENVSSLYNKKPLRLLELE